MEVVADQMEAVAVVDQMEAVAVVDQMEVVAALITLPQAGAVPRCYLVRAGSP